MDKPKGDEVVIQVPEGAAKHIRIEETKDEQPNDLTIRVSKDRSRSGTPVLGVIVK